MDLLESVTATYAVLGQEMSDLGLQAVVSELQNYPTAGVAEALARCRRELRKLTLADILDRMPGGHPKVEEAWAMVSKCLKNEQVSIVWTEQMREAYGVASALADDPVAARMAFKETYGDLLNRAKVKRQEPCWTVSLGYDPSGREVAREEAVQRNQISQSYATMLLPLDAPIGND